MCPVSTALVLLCSISFSHGSVLRRAATTSSGVSCSAPWVILAEDVLKLLPSNQGPMLCSSVLSKYTTVTSTSTVYTTTITSISVVSAVTTAPSPTTSTTTTSISTTDATALTTTTTEVDVTSISTSPVTVTTTVTPNVGRRAAAAATTNCTSKLANLLNIATSIVRDFCSCEAPGPTSTATLTTTVLLATTAHETSTSYVSTITPSPIVVIETTVTTTTATIATSILTSTTTSSTVQPLLITATITSTAPQVCASTTCANTAVSGSITTAAGGYAQYTQYIASCGVTEATNNPGNNASGSPPITTSLPGTLSGCDAISQCAFFAANGQSVYDSFDVHYLNTEQQWQCVAYYDPNSDSSYFNVKNGDVGTVFGYNFESFSS